MSEFHLLLLIKIVELLVFEVTGLNPCFLEVS